MEFFIYNLPHLLIQTAPQTQLDDFGQWSCNIITRTIEIIPESPVTLKSMSEDLGTNLPFLGGELIYLVLSDLSKALSIIIFWKLFKELPGKFS